MSASTDGLNIQQRKFVTEYLKTGNGKQSAIAAGYSEKTAYSQASRLLTHAKIKAALIAPLGKAIEKYELTAEKLIDELCTVAFADVRLSGSDKVNALGKLLEYMGLAKPKNENLGDVFNLTINLAPPEPKIIEHQPPPRVFDVPVINLEMPNA